MRNEEISQPTALLDVLDRYNVKATFFVLGAQVDAYPELTRDIARRGHSIQNHTCRHKWLTSWPSSTVAAEFECATRSIQALYPAIEQDHIVGHSDIAPGRKTDPGPHFDWNKYRTLLNA